MGIPPFSGLVVEAEKSICPKRAVDDGQRRELAIDLADLHRDGVLGCGS
jgi:hypothetical protein